MDTAILTVARDPHRGFLLRWLGAWTLATALSSLLLGVVFVCEARYHVYLGIYAFIGAMLSLPALAGLLHGIFMRPAFRRAALWAR